LFQLRQRWQHFHLYSKNFVNCQKNYLQKNNCML
jgi:hypothetical protein